MTKLNWNLLESSKQLEQLIQKSVIKPQLIFKYSNRCGLSETVFNKFQNDWNENEAQYVDPTFVDIFSTRDLSDAIERKFNIRHESPQILIIRDGECIYNNSHTRINYHKIIEQVV